MPYQTITSRRLGESFFLVGEEVGHSGVNSLKCFCRKKKLNRYFSVNCVKYSLYKYVNIERAIIETFENG